MCTADTCPLTSSVLFTHSFLDCHHVIMIAINCHQASFLRSKPVQSPLRGMWGRSVAERGPTFSIINASPAQRGPRRDLALLRSIFPAGSLYVQVYYLMKPTGVSTPFLTSALGFKTNVQCIIGVFRGGECNGPGAVPKICPAFAML